MAAYTTEVAVRWSDMDVFGHVNHACTVTLIEEARAEMLFGAGSRDGAGELAHGLLVVRLSVHYRQPLRYTGTPARVRVWMRQLHAASFTLDYEVADAHSGEVVATARTQLVPYDTAAGRPRRLTDAEREFLARYHGERGPDA